MRTAIVIPTIRPASMERFIEKWSSLFALHDVEFVIVWDGKKPYIEHAGKNYTMREVMGKHEDAISCTNGGVRNLGFAYVAKYLPDVEMILTLDDDVLPVGDPIQDHKDALSRSVPVSWISTASEYMRGFPYLIRNEAETVISHGVWLNVADWDAPTQLVLGSHRKVDFYKGVVPRGIYFPMCSMNLAFRTKALPYIYHFPDGAEFNIGRTDDIYAGVIAKREVDARGLAAVTGYATVFHERESNVFKNLQKEALEIELMETFWKGDESHPYFKKYHRMRDSWLAFMKSCGRT